MERTGVTDVSSETMTPPAAAEAAASSRERTLYERLGGYDAIAATVNELLDRLFVDPEIGVYWKGHSNDSKTRDRQLIVDFMCEAAGGPVLYRGRTMKVSHEGLGIDERDWEVFMGHTVATLDHFGVPQREKDEVLSFVTSLKGDIVEG